MGTLTLTNLCVCVCVGGINHLDDGEGGAQQQHVRGGMQLVVQRLVTYLLAAPFKTKLILNAPVHKVIQDGLPLLPFFLLPLHHFAVHSSFGILIALSLFLSVLSRCFALCCCAWCGDHANGWDGLPWACTWM